MLGGIFCGLTVSQNIRTSLKSYIRISQQSNKQELIYLWYRKVDAAHGGGVTGARVALITAFSSSVLLLRSLSSSSWQYFIDFLCKCTREALYTLLIMQHSVMFPSLQPNAHWSGQHLRPSLRDNPITSNSSLKFSSWSHRTSSTSPWSIVDYTKNPLKSSL